MEKDDAAGAERPSLTGKTSVRRCRLVMAEREPLYRRLADLAVDTTGIGADQVAKVILAACGNGPPGGCGSSKERRMTMSGNTIGVLFRVTTWGESHGPATGAVIDGCPPRIDLSEADIQEELDRRRPGALPSASPRREADRVEILSGVFEGKTTGTPISLLIRNRDADSAAYDGLRDLFRPGHGDITYQAKYGIRDHRGGGRASGRETAGRVAAGAVARKVIAQAGIDRRAWTRELGGIAAAPLSLAAAEASPLRCPDPEAEQA